MAKIDMHIEIVSSSKTWLSSMSKPSRETIRAILSRYYTNVGITLIDTMADLEALAERKPDLVFLGMKFVPSDLSLGLQDPNKIWVSGYLEERGIAHTGSGPAAHELECDKSLAKQRMLDAGLSTSPFYVIGQNQHVRTDDIQLSYPLFLKPVNRGGGLGVDSDSVVHNLEQLHAKSQSIADNLQSDTLVEEYLPGREFSVAILKDEYTREYAVMPIELIANPDKHGLRILSSKVKTADTERSVAVKDEAAKVKICELAIQAFHALGGRDYGRIDIRLDVSGVPCFLEANLVPGLKRNIGNYFPKACLLSLGLGYESMILSIIRLALSHDTDKGCDITLHHASNNTFIPFKKHSLAV